MGDWETAGTYLMTYLEFYQDDTDENSEDGYGIDNEVEDLTPLQRLEKYLDSDNIFNRQMLARGLLDTLRAVYESEDNCFAVMDAMSKLSEDPEPSVRSELMEQVPHIAVYCQENKDAFINAVPQYILPMVVRYLNDANSQVRKTSQAALLVLLEQELAEKSDIEQQVIQVILELASPESLDECRSEAAALMSKMAPLLGKDITERLFLPRFSEMCTDPLFHVRKVCAANFGEVASVVGARNCEEYLLPKFYYLCEDGVWGVRKACAECFMTVSCACSLEVRRNKLANLFVNLLCDQSRWVRMSAFQQLGPFISTFADVERTGMCVNEDGNLSFKSLESFGDDEVIEHHPGEPSLSDGDDVKEDFGGVLQLKPLDPLGTPTESSTDEPGPEVPGSSAGSEILEEDMDIDSISAGDEDQNKAVELNAADERLVFSIEDKSAEELRAENLSVQCNVDSSVDSPDVAQFPVCDTNSSSSSSNIESETRRQDVASLENVTSVGSELPEGSSAAPGGGSVLPENSSDNESPVDLAGAGDSGQSDTKFNVPSAGGAKVEGAGSDSDNVFMDNASDGQGASVTAEGNSEDPSASGKVHVHLDNNFNTFQYWRSPLPEVNIDFDIINGQPTNIHVVAKVKDEDTKKVYASEMNVNISSGGARSHSNSFTDSLSGFALGDSMSSSSSSSSALSLVQSEVEKSGVRIHTASVSTVSDAPDEMVSHIGSTHVLGQHLGQQHLAIVDGVVQDMSGLGLGFPEDMPLSLEFVQDDATLAQQQNIVPQLLLENYLGMVDPSRAQTVDGEITRHCAYNLPAVAYTLGRQNWHCIKNLYETLAQDMQWKVRRTLAFSMHQLAMIVGDEITHKDLVPVFDGFLKDLDEVRIGVLKHLADIFRLLRPEVRLQYLTRVQDFMKTDNTRNWRFREELAEQLVHVCNFFHCIDVCRDIVPVSMILCSDKVAQVRFVALRLLSAILHKTHEDEEKKLLASICNNIIQEFATGCRWLARQTFAQLCYVILEENSLPPDVFARNFLPSLLHLGTDPVPNVRLSLSKVMALRIMPLDYFTTQQNPYHEDLVHTQQRLQTDVDKDVRYFSSLQPGSDISHDHDMVPV
ncbi:serine/threonine-protein phosphatase 4 regulatory subunit 1 isoform X2 [Aplysia californica]|uniref:Serine/threonine-protein phosphatase 4 regulatory subunit 1 isoform X2 n=1 Tax=Aplysia californica TaxID=6500 RepID=A0ABM0KAH4_APLCA|nr:serine/threonine-protein phosphatase 4 regulatory subunit 1 isoform X2 [Aplysia californica]